MLPVWSDYCTGLAARWRRRVASTKNKPATTSERPAAASGFVVDEPVKAGVFVAVMV